MRDESTSGRLAFFLGGHDLEMSTIARLLQACACTTYDRQLSWGAHAKHYLTEIGQEVAKGNLPVLVELSLAELSLPDHCIIVDHHGEWAGKPSSLEQVFSLLQLPASAWTRHMSLVSANDRGHIRAMRELSPPATDDEIRTIRQADMAAQGVTSQEWRLAVSEAASAQKLCNGELTVVHTQSSRTSLIAEALEPIYDGPGYGNLLVLAPNEIAFYGSGDVIEALVAKSSLDTTPWYGGDLPLRGFFGCQRTELTFDPVEFVADKIAGLNS